MDKPAALKTFRQIPGVGPKCAQDLWDLGCRGLNDVARRDPREMYEALCALAGCHVDRCMLYVFRLAVYFARTEPEDRLPEKLKWWNWKDDPSQDHAWPEGGS